MVQIRAGMAWRFGRRDQNYGTRFSYNQVGEMRHGPLI